MIRKAKKSFIFITILSLIHFILSGCEPKVVTPPPAVKPAKVALVLGAGAARGFAHVGVLKILEANKVPIHMIVGTSAGSFVGAAYAYGYNAYQLQVIAFSLERDQVFDLVLPDNGFIKGERLQIYVNKLVNDTPLERLKIPFYAIATDLGTGEEVGFARGNTGMAVRASCSIPGVFQPVKIAGRTYVDGGVVSPVAVDFARKMGAEVVIAVDISSGISGSLPKGTIETILQSIDIMQAKISESQLKRADIVIRPRVGYISSSDLSKKHEAILEGEKAALEAWPKIQQILTPLKEAGRLP
ncbi:MAG TPA: patatin-like phospholipase family protein [Syntrophales bacterium]|nr:patatin-like phospholipase family protein [Syntrophales bacterium]HOL59993.1 patatin-like phospholipase family protein [Syntrophales bacterium]HPO36132.1 patatin-like phospholipase family protein [Syntrophales bacterium]